MNLLSSKYYNPASPRVGKVRMGRNTENDILIYIGNVRSLGWCEWGYWK